jgi:hypothetical protein
MTHNRQRAFSVFFNQHADRATSDRLRDRWLAEIAGEPGVTQQLEHIGYKDRTVYRTKAGGYDLAITHHEWGVEYIFSFALGVASSVVAGVIYDVLKSHLPRYRKTLAGPQRTTQPFAAGRKEEIRVEVEIDTPNGPAKIAVVQRTEESFTATRKQIQRLVDLIDEEKRTGTFQD